MVAGVAALSLVAGIGGGWVAAGQRDAGTPANPIGVSRASMAISGDTLDVAGIVAALKGSVVTIDTRITERQGPMSRSGKGAGTGIVLDDNGYILTNAHVVADSTSVTVSLPGDAKPRSATVVGADTAHDIAVVKVDDVTGLVPATFGDSSTLAVGDGVVAMGNALALEGGLTVTQGIISALDRSVPTENGTLSHVIQTDAAISSGNSGGALVDALGQVIGMNTAVATSSQTVSASNIGFAISIDQATTIASSIIQQR